MTRKPIFFAVAIAVCGAAASLANAQVAGHGVASAATSATDLRLSLVGSWTGGLGYRDYQTNELLEIPVTTTIEALPDGVTMVRRSLFDDGPDKPVWITTVSLDDRAAGTSIQVAFRAGRPVEPLVETLTTRDVRDSTHWTVIHKTTGIDGDTTAEIRVTETLDGDTLLAIKEVRPVNGSEDSWAYRNQTRLQRSTPNATGSAPIPPA